MFRFQRVVLTTALLLVVTGCTPAPATSSSTLKGLSFSPASYDNAGIGDFFSKASTAGEIVTWQGDWQQLETDTAAPYVITQFANTYKYTPIIIVHAFINEAGIPIRPLSSNTRQSYLDSISQYATAYKPENLGIGVEINVLYEQSTAEFDNFVSLFNDAYDLVKTVSPDTTVFTTWQLEHMKGLRGGLFGGKNDTSQAQWHLLDRLSKADLFAFTTYPGILYASPSEISTDYYTEISTYTTKPIAISETGWFRTAPAGWDESDAQEQGDFIARLFETIAPLNPQFIIWSFLYDPGSAQPVFGTMGLLKADEVTSVPWEAWKAIKQ